MENNKKNRRISFMIVTGLLIVVTLILVMVLILGINRDNQQKQLIAELTEELDGEEIKGEEQKIDELDELVEILQGEPEEYLTMVGLSGNKELPTFTNINQADPEWLWGNVRDCMTYMAKENFNYEEIIDYAKVIYGDNFNLQLSKEGKYGFTYDNKTNQYNIDEMIEDIEDEDEIYFTIKNVNKNTDKVTVEVVEYTVKQEFNEEDKETLSLYDKNGKLVKSYEVDDESDDDYMEKWENIEEDSKAMEASKKIELELSEKQIYQIISISKM